ncbi:MAG: flavodoxin family protein [Firmicutes bacterium]|nr:flavodoxin family protein [Bacillota bacterium]
MKFTILMGSPRKEGNTAALLEPFVKTLEREGAECEVLWLYDMDLHPCTACRTCQKDWTIFGCPQQDDVIGIFDKVLSSDVLVLATPIYSWYCTPPMKNVIDRLVYGMNKYYGESMGPALWKGKKMALISTCGYPTDKGADLWEEGMKRYCKHSHLEYLGMKAMRQRKYGEAFMDEEKIEAMAEFARHCMASVEEA